jgi:2-amino-4-hydroxy-6-hydroxymethyldihydropteridine diphosphokinase
VRRRAYIGLGSNLNDPAQQLRQALQALARLPDTQLLAQSRLYRTPPWGVLEQPAFVNAVAELDTGLAPRQLLDALLQIEQAAGRVRVGERWGPRVLDLDLLHMVGIQQHDAQLSLPHPRIAERAFVLLPLAELAPTLHLPGQGVVADLLMAVDHADCVILG